MTPTVTQVHGDSRSLTSLPENRLQTCSQHRWDLSTLESPLPHSSVLLPQAKNTSAPLSLWKGTMLGRGKDIMFYFKERKILERQNAYNNSHLHLSWFCGFFFLT